MRGDPELDSVFRPVAEYYRARLEGRGDVYGWGRLSGPPRPAAVLLADPRAAAVPTRIAEVDIVIERVEAPEALTR